MFINRNTEGGQFSFHNPVVKRVHGTLTFLVDFPYEHVTLSSEHRQKLTPLATLEQNTLLIVNP